MPIKQIWIELNWIELNWIELNWIELRERDRDRQTDRSVRCEGVWNVDLYVLPLSMSGSGSGSGSSSGD